MTDVIGLIAHGPELATAIGHPAVVLAEDRVAGVGCPLGCVGGGRVALVTLLVVEAKGVGDGPVEAGVGAVVVRGHEDAGAGGAGVGAGGVVAGGGGGGAGVGALFVLVLALEGGAVPDEPDDEEDEEEAEDVAEDDGDEPEAVVGA